MSHDRVAPDAIALNAASSACEKGIQWKHAVEFLSEMWHDRFAPNTLTFSAATALARRECN